MFTYHLSCSTFTSISIHKPIILSCNKDNIIGFIDTFYSIGKKKKKKKNQSFYTNGT